MKEDHLEVLIKQINELDHIEKIKFVLSMLNDKINEVEAPSNIYTKDEIDKIIKDLEDKIQACCDGGGPGPEPTPKPSIRNFALNVVAVDSKSNQSLTRASIDFEGVEKIKFDTATFDILNEDTIRPKSLRIVYLNKNQTIANNLDVSSPSKFTEIILPVTENSTHEWQAIIEDVEGTEYRSNIFSVRNNAKPLPPTADKNTIYIGNTDTMPKVFQDMPIDQIFNLEDNQPRKIKGLGVEDKFVIKQTKKIHYLLIPEEHVTLVRSEMGDQFISVFWDDKTQEGVYFRTNPGGVHDGIDYRVFFFYYASGNIPDDIRVTCKNKN